MNSKMDLYCLKHTNMTTTLSVLCMIFYSFVNKGLMLIGTLMSFPKYCSWSKRFKRRILCHIHNYSILKHELLTVSERKSIRFQKKVIRMKYFEMKFKLKRCWFFCANRIPVGVLWIISQMRFFAESLRGHPCSTCSRFSI